MRCVGGGGLWCVGRRWQPYKICALAPLICEAPAVGVDGVDEPAARPLPAPPDNLHLPALTTVLLARVVGPMVGWDEVGVGWRSVRLVSGGRSVGCRVDGGRRSIDRRHGVGGAVTPPAWRVGGVIAPPAWRVGLLRCEARVQREVILCRRRLDVRVQVGNVGDGRLHRRWLGVGWRWCRLGAFDRRNILRRDCVPPPCVRMRPGWQPTTKRQESVMTISSSSGT